MCFALFAWFSREELLAGTAKTATGKVCNEYETAGRLCLACVEMLGHNRSFPKNRFLDSGCTN